jgi:hypothetical protein
MPVAVIDLIAAEIVDVGVPDVSEVVAGTISVERAISTSTRPIGSTAGTIAAATRPITSAARSISTATRPITTTARPISAASEPITATARPNSTVTATGPRAATLEAGRFRGCRRAEELTTATISFE